jgi:hypothetical protein
LKEAFEIEGILTLEREGEWLRVRQDEKFLEDAWENIQRTDEIDSLFRELLGKRKEDLLKQSVRAPVKGEERGDEFFSRYL